MLDLTVLCYFESITKALNWLYDISRRITFLSDGV